MRKLLLLLLLLPVTVNAQMLVGGMSGGIASYCTSSTACGTNHCNLICEDIESTTDCDGTTSKCRLTWTIAEAGAGTSVEFNNVPSSGLSCTSGNNQNVEVTVAGTAGHTAVAGKNLGSDQSVLGGSLYFRWDTTLTTGLVARIVTAENSSSQTTLLLFLVGDSGNKIRAQYCKTDACTTGVNGTTALSINTWYRLSWLWTPGAGDTGTLVVYIDDSLEINVADVDNYRTIRNFYIGQRAAGNTAYLMEIKNIRLDNTQRPEACE